ncbi:MAG: alpha/beta fold hydrolase [Gammaproteobacteria bacterium]
MSTYILVHGAWHTGALFEATAVPLRAAGHEVLTPTLLGNRPGDRKDVTIDAVIEALAGELVAADVQDAVLVGHSYGGMVITGVADRLAERFRRLVYWNAFVPLDGECLNDLVLPEMAAAFDALADEHGAVMLPFPLWREAFINDADLALAEASYAKLNAHPLSTFATPVMLRHNPSDLPVAKSYINCTGDTALPQSLGWHPRMSERLGLFRLVETPGSHELCFTNPELLAQKIVEAGRN